MENKENAPAGKELSPEQVRYLASFKEAMSALERKYKREKHWPNEFKEMVRSRMWSPDILAFCYTAVAGKISRLPKRLRDYVLLVGALAKELFDAAEALENGKNEQEHGQDNQAQ